jgi:hypothetical protein
MAVDNTRRARSPITLSTSRIVDCVVSPIAPRARLVPRHEPNDYLLGHATVAFASGIVIPGIPIFRRKDGVISCGEPNAPQITRDGTVRTIDGKRQYTPVISFTDNHAKERWRNAVLQALEGGGAPRVSPTMMLAEWRPEPRQQLWLAGLPVTHANGPLRAGAARSRCSCNLCRRP